MDNKGLKELQIGEEFAGYCIIRKKELKQKKNGDFYLKLELGDRSGRLSGKIWQDAKEYYDGLKVGQVIKMRGTIQTYRGNKEIQIHRLRPVQETEEKIVNKLIPRSSRDIHVIKQEFLHHMDSITNKYFRRLLQQIFKTDGDLEKFLSSPSGKLWHHNYLYGNLEHLVCLLDMTNTIAVHYPSIKKELLKTAIILRNLGNTLEFHTAGFIEYTTLGRLLGHSILSFQRLMHEIDSIPDFPKELKIQLLHLILSQENQVEKTVSVLPMTVEAIILNQLIQLDILTNAAHRIIRNDLIADSRWTKFNNLLQRFLYVPEDKEEK